MWQKHEKKKKKSQMHRQAPSPSSRNSAEMTTRASYVYSSSALLSGSEAGHGEASFMSVTEHHSNRKDTALTVQS